MTNFTFTAAVPVPARTALKRRAQAWIDQGAFPQVTLRLLGNRVTLVRSPWPPSADSPSDTTVVSLLTVDDRKALLRWFAAIGSPND